MIRLTSFTGLLWRSDHSVPYLTATYFMALSHRIDTVGLDDHHIFKNLNPKHPTNPFLIDLFQLWMDLDSKFVLLITYFGFVYMGHVAL